MSRTSVGFWLLLTACEGPAGEDGLDGVDGLDGANGANGANGQNGADGQDGASGADGADGVNGVDGEDALGVHFGTAPWGLSLTIDAISGGTGAGGAILPGDTLTVVFRVEDDAGVPYDLTTLTGLDFQLAGPSDHLQVLIERSEFGSPRFDAVWDPAADAWELTLPTPVPATYHTPANDTPAFALADGDWGGEPVVDGTYRLAGWASLRHTWTDGTTWTEASNAAYEVLLGTAVTLEPHEVVNPDACAGCHGPTLDAHGGSRTAVEVCTVCHVAGAEDRYSVTDPTTTPGASIQLASMVHGIHFGVDRPTPLLLNGYPADPTLPGYPDYNEHDWSAVVFPVWPEGATTCAKCHAGAAQGDVENRPSTLACTGCHSDVDLRGGTGHTGGAQPDDSLCAGCHDATAVVGYHADPRGDAALNPGVTVTVIGVAPGSGPNGVLLPGDPVVVEFEALHDDGSVVDISTTYRAEIVFAGPTDHFQQILLSPSGDVVANAVFDAVAGTWSYTLGTLPAVYPPQPNDTVDLGLESGDWSGQPLVDGTYRAVVMVTLQITDGVGTWKVPVSDAFELRVGTDGALAPREVVDEASCQTCHDQLRFHGDNRAGLEACQTCHTAGAEDRYSATDPSTTPGATIHLSTMVHKIHNGSNLTTDYALNGFGSPYTTHTFEQVIFPRFDGGTATCEACHGGFDAWTAPSTVACTSCHDSVATMAHAAINTDPVWGESCDVCHGVGSIVAVDVMHRWGQPH